jgi:hypothetical protein
MAQGKSFRCGPRDNTTTTRPANTGGWAVLWTELGFPLAITP